MSQERTVLTDAHFVWAKEHILLASLLWYGVCYFMFQLNTDFYSF